MKTQVIKQVTEEQVISINYLFDKVYSGVISDEKRELITKSICGGETGITEQLTHDEANRVIQRLLIELKCQETYKKVMQEPITEEQIKTINGLYDQYPSEHTHVGTLQHIRDMSEGRTDRLEDLTYWEADVMIREMTKYLKKIYRPATKAQINKIYSLLSKKGKMDEKEELLHICSAADTIENINWYDAEIFIEYLFEYNDVIKSNKKPVTPAQIKKIHVLLRENGLIDQKENMLYSISDGRTTSTKELTCNEAKRLIAFLMDDQAEIQNKQKVLVKAIWHLAWDMGIIYGETDDDYEMNKAKLNMFCRQRGTVKKNLTEQNLVELRKTHRQFEAMYAKHKNKVSK